MEDSAVGTSPKMEEVHTRDIISVFLPKHSRRASLELKLCLHHVAFPSKFLLQRACHSLDEVFIMPADIRSFFGGKPSQAAAKPPDKKEVQ